MTLAKQIDQLINQQYRENCISVQPCFPWILLRVCKKEQERNGLWLPDSTQNKTLHEGIVLSTWQPCQRVQNGYTIDLSSELKPGDHVLFNHFAGVPLEGRSSGYRLVKECDFAVDKEGGIIAALGYDELHTNPVEKLRKLFADECEWNQGMEYSEAFIEKITKHFILVDKDTPSVTISGR
jgi:co-chaperonin GroES (HSP10)